MFNVFRQELNQVKSERLTDEERKKRNKQIRKKYRMKFSRLLHLIPKKSETMQNFSNNIYHSPEKPKSAKSLDGLINLYKELYVQLDTKSKQLKEPLESEKFSKRCRKLRKMFKSRKSDIELLLDNDEEKLAKQLIACTSKILLTKYVI